MVAKWLENNILPRNKDATWIVYERGQFSSFNFDEILIKLRKWQPSVPFLVGKPGKEQLVPPIEIEELTNYVHGVVRSNYIKTIIYFMIPFFLFITFSIIYSSGNALLYAGAFFIFPAFLIIDYYKYIKYSCEISERARYYFWLHEYSEVKKYLIYSVIFMLFIGGGQVTLQYIYGGIGPVLYGYGIVYELINHGELWRFLYGYIFHYSLVHYIVNFVMFVPVYSVSITIIGKKAIVLFMLLNTFGAAVQYYYGEHVLESCSGISFGIYGLLGTMSGIGLSNNKVLPKGLGQLFIGIALSGICIVEVTSKNAATAGHIGGFLIGLFISIIFIMFNDKSRC
jgi:hypothetical protein